MKGRSREGKKVTGSYSKQNERIAKVLKFFLIDDVKENTFCL